MYNDKAIKRYQEGRDFHQMGNFSAAERAYKKAIKINPDFVEAYNDLANAYLDSGRFNKAFNEYQKALKLIPNHPKLLNNIGNALLLQGEYEKALPWFNKAINQDTDYANAHSNSGDALWGLGKSVEAVAAYERALQLNPELADTHYNLGGLLTELGLLEDAAKCFNEALRINPADKNALQGLGRVRNEQGDLDQAVSAYQKAIALDPLNEEFYEELGKTLSDHGEIEKSVSAYRKAVEINPENAAAYRALAKNNKFTDYNDDMKAMESLFSQKELLREDSINLAFALGKAYEDLGNFDKSMEFVIKAARLKRSSYDYSISESKEQFDKIKALFSTDFFSKHSAAGSPDQTPIFILGMPRSGTSLVEQILASHADVFGAGEINDLAIVFESMTKPLDKEPFRKFPDGLSRLDNRALTDLGNQYVSRIRRYADDARFITDKMPHNFLHIGLIRVTLPNARIIHCTRDPMDNCLSIFKTYLVNGHRYSYDLSELGQYYRMYLELMDFWKDRLPGFIYDQNYEELVGSPKQQVQNLLRHCGLPWDDACLDFHQTRRRIGTASSAQVNRPIYNNSVNLWARYEKYLDPLKTAIYG
jgi:tetratricopeptide (TPR) repeat protein